MFFHRLRIPSLDPALDLLSPGAAGEPLVIGLCLGIGLFSAACLLVLPGAAAQGRAQRLRLALRLLGLVSAIASAWLALGWIDRQRAEELLRDANAQLADEAMFYLADRCRSERRLLVPQASQVPPSGEGVVLDIDPTARLALPDAPSPLSGAPHESGRPRPRDAADPLRQHERQYRLPLDWFDTVVPLDVLATSTFAFVEQDLRGTVRDALVVTARKLWWDTAGRELVQADRAADLRERLARADILQPLQAPVLASSAHFVLRGRDISTLEDRRHWVARGQLQLIDRRDGSLLAEYVGFAAHRRPAYEPAQLPAWRDSALCVGPERAYQRDGARFELVRFFMAHALRAVMQPGPEPSLKGPETVSEFAGSQPGA